MTVDSRPASLAEAKVELDGSRARWRFGGIEVELDLAVRIAHFLIDADLNRIAFLCGESEEQQRFLEMTGTYECERLEPLQVPLSLARLRPDGKGPVEHDLEATLERALSVVRVSGSRSERAQRNHACP